MHVTADDMHQHLVGRVLAPSQRHIAGQSLISAKIKLDAWYCLGRLPYNLLMFPSADGHPQMNAINT